MKHAASGGAARKAAREAARGAPAREIAPAATVAQPPPHLHPSLNPNLYKTRLCRRMQQPGGCNLGERCAFAHSEHELAQAAARRAAAQQQLARGSSGHRGAMEGAATGAVNASVAAVGSVAGGGPGGSVYGMLAAARQCSGGSPPGGPHEGFAHPPISGLPPVSPPVASGGAAVPRVGRAGHEPPAGPHVPLDPLGPHAAASPVSPERNLARELELESLGLHWRGDGNAAGARPRTTAPGGGARGLDEAELCLICMDAPQQLRFGCGHACCCRKCLPRLTALDGLCPTCRAPIVLNELQTVEEAATFVPPQAPDAQSARPSKGGRGGRGEIGRAHV